MSLCIDVEKIYVDTNARLMNNFTLQNVSGFFSLFHLLSISNKGNAFTFAHINVPTYMQICKNYIFASFFKWHANVL